MSISTIVWLAETGRAQGSGSAARKSKQNSFTLGVATGTANAIAQSCSPSVRARVGPRWTVETDGSVRAVAKSGETVYFGGTFGYVGAHTGGAVLVDATAGALVPGFPAAPLERVDAAASDAAGGWYVASCPSIVRGRCAEEFVHLRADGTSAPAWHPAPDEAVTRIAVSGSTVYVGGFFEHIGGKARLGLRPY